MHEGSKIGNDREGVGDPTRRSDGRSCDQDTIMLLASWRRLDAWLISVRHRVGWHRSVINPNEASRLLFKLLQSL